MNSESTKDNQTLFKQEENRRVDQLLERMESRLGRIENPLSSPISKILRENCTLLFSSQGHPRDPQEQQVMLSILGLFAYNNWPPDETVGKINGVLKKAGGVIIEGHWRINSGRQDYLILTSNGRVDETNQLHHLLGRMQVAAECVAGIVAALKKGRGRQLLVCTDELGVILKAALTQTGELILSSPVFAEPSRVKMKTTIEILEKLITTPVYPHKVEIDF